MRIDLTIKKDYLPTWHFPEGVRELVQNGIDAQTEHSAPLTVDWVDGKLRVENDGCVLARETLLLGQTSKAGNSRMIGQFGEGMKLGILALVRDGHEVTVRSGPEVWKPSIRKSEQFGADVLSFDVSGGREPKNRVRVEVTCEKERWEEVKELFLVLGRRTEGDRVETSRGTLLLAPRFCGKVFVKGIFVQHDPQLNHGYDFVDAQVDRDRRMLGQYDVGRHAQAIWEAAMATHPDLVEKFTRLLATGARDVDNVRWGASSLSQDVREAVAADFVARHGQDAVPAENLDQSRALSHLGKKGVVANPGLLAVVASVIGDAEDAEKRLRDEVKKTFSWDDLSAGEQENLNVACDLVKRGRPNFTFARVDVVEFRSPTYLGQHKDGRYLLAKKTLATRRTALETLVHEVSHDEGGDGDHDHVAALESLWGKIVESLLPAVAS